MSALPSADPMDVIRNRTPIQDAIVNVMSPFQHTTPAVTLPSETVHFQTMVVARTWDSYDRARNIDGWQATLQSENGQVLEFKRRNVPGGGALILLPPFGEPRPATMLCPNCQGAGYRVVGRVDGPMAEERAVVCWQCCESDGESVRPGDGRVMRPMRPLPFSEEDLVPEAPEAEREEDIPW